MDIKPLTINLPSSDQLDMYSLRFNSITDAIDRANEERSKRANETIQAIHETAENTAEMRDDLKDVIRNLNDYIILLKQSNQMLSDQLDALKKLFVSGEDGVAIQKEILGLIAERKIDLRALAADKGADAVLQTIFMLIPIAIQSLRIF